MMRITFLILLLALAVISASAQSEQLSEVTISATIRTYVLDAPRPNAEFIRGYAAGATQSAFGRDADADWLRILDGWVLAEVFNTVGQIGALPDATNSINVRIKRTAQLYEGPSARWFDAISDIAANSKALAIGRNDLGTWVRLSDGWIEAAKMDLDDNWAALPVISAPGVIITAKTRTFILAEPNLSAEFVDVFEAGEEALAIGRAGDWLKIAQGWVSAEAVEASGDEERLPFAGGGIPIVSKRKYKLSVMAKPEILISSVLRKLDPGAEETAVGRTENGEFLFVGDGWVQASGFEADGNIMSLPITDGSANSVTSSVRATATPRPATRSASSSSRSASSIRSLVSRHTDDIRILGLDISNSATTIEYDLKPWPFVPNEQIANEVAFKIICAIRKGQQIPKTLKLIGQGHFKSDIGRKFKSPSVEIHISASNANRLVCAGNDHSDINWRSVSSLYKSYPIPRDSSVDYD